MESSPPSSRRNSIISQATSTRHMLDPSTTTHNNHNNNHNTSTPEPFIMPSAPFTPAPLMSSQSSYFTQGSSPLSPFSREDTGSTVSLAVNYIPRKFSSTMLNPNGSARRRKNAGKGSSSVDPRFPKLGGGVEAFRSGENRMPSGTDEDGSRSKGRLKWNKFKWILFVANLLFTIYAIVGLVVCLLTWFNAFLHADVVRVGNRAELVLCTLTAICGLLTSMIGWAGILLNNRSFLAVYTFLTWITFALLVTPGYVTYRRRTFNLEGKINAQWSRQFDTASRLRIQNELQCCGYYNPFVEATVSATCYSRSSLPGCKSAFLTFERMVLKKFYATVFGLVPLQIGIMVAALLCSNHVTYRFGKGMMPKAYRLSLASVAVIMDQYANQIAEQYGQGVASEIMTQSRANLIQFDATPTTPYPRSSRESSTTGLFQPKYDSVRSRTPGEELGVKPSTWF